MLRMSYPQMVPIVNQDYTGPRDRARLQDARIAYQMKRRAIRFAAASAGLQAVAKGVTGLLTGSLALLAMAADSLGDFLNLTVARIAVRQGGRPPDPEHPFGHGKIEPLGGLLQVLILLPVIYGLVRLGIGRLSSGGHVEAPGIGIAVIAASALVGMWTARGLERAADRTDSVALRGSGLTFRMDAVTHLGVICSLLVVDFTGWTVVDTLTSFAVALYVVVITLRHAWESAGGLLDPRLADEYRERVIMELEEHADEFLNYHRLRTRQAGPEKHVDLHLTICRYRTLEEAHRLADHLENAIEALVPQSHVIIHVDPCKSEQSCVGEDRCSLAAERRDLFPATDWPAHPTGPEARRMEREQHRLDAPGAGGRERDGG